MNTSNLPTSAANVTKKTEQQQQQHQQQLTVEKSSSHKMEHELGNTDDENDEIDNEIAAHQRTKHDSEISQKDKMDTHSELMIEPKNEYDDNDETVEDLTLEDDELLEDLEQAGPSHGGEGSSQGNFFLNTFFFRT